MNELGEGVIKFECRHTAGPPPSGSRTADLRAWRKILFALELIGQVPTRYQGLGFGNISARAEGNAFIITGTQTGGLADLNPEHFVMVRSCDTENNRIVSSGPVNPSSESLTHGVLYQLQEQIGCVIHVHSPQIWHYNKAMDLPATRADVPYGTPAMAEEVHRLWHESDAAVRGIFVMGGHEDGVVACGPDVAAAGTILVNYLAKALRLEGADL